MTCLGMQVFVFNVAALLESGRWILSAAQDVVRFTENFVSLTGEKNMDLMENFVSYPHIIYDGSCEKEKVEIFVHYILQSSEI